MRIISILIFIWLLGYENSGFLLLHQNLNYNQNELERQYIIKKQIIKNHIIDNQQFYINNDDKKNILNANNYEQMQIVIDKIILEQELSHKNSKLHNIRKELELQDFKIIIAKNRISETIKNIDFLKKNSFYGFFDQIIFYNHYLAFKS